jgi:glutathionylspermidine synthase
MLRNTSKPRLDYQRIIRDQGLVFDTAADGSPYWDETAYYAFTIREIDQLHAAARELHTMFLAAAEHVLAQPEGLAQLEIPAPLHEPIRRSWKNDEWEFYGRFDFTMDHWGVPKLIEYNADTPTGLLEAAVIQWYWKEDRFHINDQFNSIHESLVRRWGELLEHGQLTKSLTHFTSVANHPEDRITVGYIARTAEEAGLEVEYIPVKRIGWDRNHNEFLDEKNRPIRQLFKLYPWEWMGQEAFATNLALARWLVLEPPWKAIFASKKLLLVLQELYPDHPHLLKVSSEPPRGDYVAKPTFGREGGNVALFRRGAQIDKREGRPGLGSLIYQEYCPLLQARPGVFAQCGVWMAGPEPVGLGVREDTRPILGNTSRFVPHIIS